MKKERIAYLIALFGILSNTMNAQSDIPGNEKENSSEYYIGLGLGYGNKGIAGAICGTFVLSNDWGGSISVRQNNYLSENLPDDFFETQFNIFKPHDNVGFISLRVLKEFPLSGKKVEYGIEAGPSIGTGRITEFSINPNFPDGGLWGLPVNKYTKTYTNEKSIGISLRAKAEFGLVNFLGIETAIYSEINKVHSFTGLELYFNLGKVGN